MCWLRIGPALLAPPRSRGWTRDARGATPAASGSPALAGMDPSSAVVDFALMGLPRARGDGPMSKLLRSEQRKAPPRSRGWTHTGDRRPGPAPGSPALAGMDPVEGTATHGSSRLPRARGDGPVELDPATVAKLAPPRSRGWTQGGADRALARPGSPALAGMDPTPHTGMPQPLGLPRARGDGPESRTLSEQSFAAPPRSRGWTRARRARARRHRGSPALAGMDPRSGARPSSVRRLPRARGDGPIVCFPDCGLIGAPPRSRGWTQGLAAQKFAEAGSPALAGMDPSRASRGRSSPRLPRARGDGPVQVDHFDASSAAPPPPSPRARRSRPGLPRARGDGPFESALFMVDLGAPPRSRGWTRSDELAKERDAGSPALAGMDPWPAPTHGPGRRLPRARGDGPNAAEALGRVLEAPPRSRGWTLRGQVVRGRLRGSPALAGMDPRQGRQRPRPCGLPRARGDGPRGKTRAHRRSGLPRARGDGPADLLAAAGEKLAPPRSRGWTPEQAEPEPDANGSPALAGMDPIERVSSALGVTPLPEILSPLRVKRNQVVKPGELEKHVELLARRVGDDGAMRQAVAAGVSEASVVVRDVLADGAAGLAVVRGGALPHEPPRRAHRPRLDSQTDTSPARRGAPCMLTNSRGSARAASASSFGAPGARSIAQFRDSTSQSRPYGFPGLSHSLARTETRRVRAPLHAVRAEALRRASRRCSGWTPRARPGRAAPAAGAGTASGSVDGKRATRGHGRDPLAVTVCT